MKLGTPPAISIFEDLSWLVVLTVFIAIVHTQIWEPFIFGQPRRSLKAECRRTLWDFLQGVPILLLDRYLVGAGYVSRIKGRFLPISTIWPIALVTVFPVAVFGIAFIVFTMFPRIIMGKKAPKRLKDAAIDSILQPFAAPPDEVCGICKDDFEKAVQLPCQHIFCDRCIRLALRERGACPICAREYA